jgi:hypothetical protein
MGFHGIDWQIEGRRHIVVRQALETRQGQYLALNVGEMMHFLSQPYRRLVRGQLIGRITLPGRDFLGLSCFPWRFRLGQLQVRPTAALSNRACPPMVAQDVDRDREQPGRQRPTAIELAGSPM